MGFVEEKVTHEKLVLAAFPANRNAIKTHHRKLTQSGQINSKAQREVFGTGLRDNHPRP